MQRSRRHLRSPDRRWRHQIAASLCWKEIATPLRGSQRRIATALPDLGMTIRNRSFVGAVTRLRDARLRLFLWEQAYKPGSVTGPLTLPSPPSRGVRSMRSYQTATISLGRLLPGASCSLPGDAAGRLISPYVALHRAGFAQVSGHPEPRALLPHDCTLTLNHSLRSDSGRRPVPEPQANGAGRYVSVALSLGSPPTGSYPAPCPLVSGLSSESLRFSAVARPAPAIILAFPEVHRNRMPGVAQRVTLRGTG